MSKPLVLLPLALGAILLSQPARAAAAAADVGSDPEAIAAAHFRRALHLVDSGAYEPALEEFRRAYDTVPRYQVLYNIGLVLKLLNRPQQSREALERYLRIGGPAIPVDRRAEVQSLLDSMAPAPGATPADAPILPVEPTVPVGGRESTPALQAAPAPRGGGPEVSTELRSPADRPADARATQGGLRAGPVLAISAATIGVAALSLYLWNHTRWQRWRTEDGRLFEAGTAPPPATAIGELLERQARNDALLDSIHSLDRVALGLGVAAGVGGLLAWWFWSPAEKRPTPALVLDPRSSSVSVSWTGAFE